MALVSRDLGVSYPRHTWWYRTFLAVVRPVVLPIVKMRMKIKTRPERREMDKPSILLYNHVSNSDFICSLDLYRPYTRYILSDAMLRNKFNAIIYPICADFIYRRKGDKGDDTVESVKATIKKGISVGLSAEGGVSTNGTTEEIRPRTGVMVKECGCGMVTMISYGGYFIYPTWSHYKAKGPMFGKVVGIYTKEQVAAMTSDEINATIAKDLYFNHYEWNREARIPYVRKNRAEWMERVAGICPKCRTVGSMHSHIDDLSCEKCGYKVTVDDYGFFNGDDVIFDNLYDWDMWQRNYLISKRQEWLDSPDEIITTDEHLSISVLRNNMPVTLDEDVRLEMDAKEIRIIGEKCNMTMPLDEMGGIIRAIPDGFGIVYKDDYYQLKAPYPLWNAKHRYIRKILRGESISVTKTCDTV